MPYAQLWLSYEIHAEYFFAVFVQKLEFLTLSQFECKICDLALETYCTSNKLHKQTTTKRLIFRTSFGNVFDLLSSNNLLLFFQVGNTNFR